MTVNSRVRFFLLKCPATKKEIEEAVQVSPRQMEVSINSLRGMKHIKVDRLVVNPLLGTGQPHYVNLYALTLQGKAKCRVQSRKGVPPISTSVCECNTCVKVGRDEAARLQATE